MTEKTEALATAKAKAKKKSKKKVATKAGLKNLTVKVANIKPVENWNRVKLGDISLLRASITQIGLTIPLLVRAGSAAGTYQLVDGMRRLAALQAEGFATASVSLSTAKTDEEAERQAAAANLAREEHTPYEKVLMFQRESEVYNQNHDEIARANACTAGYVSQHLAVLKADPRLQEAFKAGTMALVMFRHFARLNREADADFYAKMMTKAFDGASAQSIGDYTAVYLTRKAAKAAQEAAKTGAKAPKTPAKRGAAAHKSNAKKPELVIPDYRSVAVSKKIKMVKKSDAIDWLDTYRDKALKATTARVREYNLGVLEGMEIMTHLLVED